MIVGNVPLLYKTQGEGILQVVLVNAGLDLRTLITRVKT